MHYDVLCLNTNMRSRSSAIFSDNTPTVAWCTKMADNSISPVAGRLLRGFEMIQLQEISAPVLLTHMAGEKNKMADYASWSYNNLLRTSTNTKFLAVFNSTFPIQGGTWTSAALPTKIISNVISLLRGRWLVMRKWTTIIKQATGSTGKTLPNNLHLQVTHAYRETATTGSAYRIFFIGQGGRAQAWKISACGIRGCCSASSSTDHRNGWSS